MRKGIKKRWARLQDARQPVGQELKRVAYLPDEPKSPPLTFYTDAPEKTLPLLLYFHGDRPSARQQTARAVARTGFHVAVLGCGYDTVFPKSVDYAASAYRYFTAHMDGYRAERIFIGGDGVGAYIASILTSRLSARQTGALPAGVVLFSGVYDLPRYFQKTTRGRADIGHAIFGRKAVRTGEYRRLLQEPGVSPADTAGEWRFPACVFHSENDALCLGQGSVLVSELAEAGIPHWEFRALKAAKPHNWQLHTADLHAIAALGAAAEFMEEAGQHGMQLAYRYIEI